jgi:hypothetical protein
MPFALERWSTRIVPFKSAIDEFLRVRPPGLAMAQMNTRFNTANLQLTWLYDQLASRRAQLDERYSARIADAFIFRSDAQNYMIFGDPAARPRVPEA